MEQVYLDLQARIRALDAELEAAGLQPVKHIAPYTGLNPEKNSAFNRPAVFVEFVLVSWEDYSQGAQAGTVQLRIHVVMDATTEGHESSRDQAKFLNVYKYPRILNEGLQGYAAPSFSRLTRLSDSGDPTPDSLYVHVITYQTLVQDFGPSRKTRNYVLTAGDGELETIPLAE